MSDTPQNQPSVDRFPRRPLIVGMVAILLVALSSAGSSLFVTRKLHTITDTQIVVLTASQQLKQARAQQDLLLHAVIETSDERFRLGYIGLRPQIDAALMQLNRAIQLKDNKRTFSEVVSAKQVTERLEAEAFNTLQTDGGVSARQLLKDQGYLRSKRIYDIGAAKIHKRSLEFVAANKSRADSALIAALVATILGVLALSIAWTYLVWRTSAWAGQVRDARAQAEQAAQAKTEFLAVMSHEIRTPLNSIIGFADVLLQDEQIDGRRRHQVGLIHDAGLILLTVVNDILDFSKIEAGKLEIERTVFSLESLLDNCASIFRPSAEEKGLSFFVKCDPNALGIYDGDENRLRQVLVNLLSNAIKFTNAGKIILHVENGGRSRLGRQLRFMVEDTGIGITREQQERLFQPFFQSDTSIARRFGGTGLGLSICRRLMEAMGGSIRVESKLESGTTFICEIVLPVAADRQPDEALPQGPLKIPLLESLRILLAEDLPMNQELAVLILERAGHKVDVVSDGRAAVDAAAQVNYDLILMDIQMPVLDGISAAQAIRALTAPAGQTPIIALTANVLPEQAHRFRDAGMNGRVLKPIKQQEMFAEIARVVGGRRPDKPEVEQNDDAVFDGAKYKALSQMIPIERLEGYARALAGQVGEVAEAGQYGDLRTCAFAAHKVASQAAMFGLVELARVSRELELLCEQNASPCACLSDLSRARKRAFSQPEIKQLLGGN